MFVEGLSKNIMVKNTPENNNFERRANDIRIALLEKSVKDIEKVQLEYKQSLDSVHKRISETRTLTLAEQKSNFKEFSDALDVKLKVFTDKFDNCSIHIGNTSVLFKALSYVEWAIYVVGAGLLIVFGWIYTHATGTDHSAMHQVAEHLKKLKSGG